MNFGGGFGVSEDGETNFDVKSYGLKVSELMQKTSKMHKKDMTKEKYKKSTAPTINHF